MGWECVSCTKSWCWPPGRSSSLCRRRPLRSWTLSHHPPPPPSNVCIGPGSDLRERPRICRHTKPEVFSRSQKTILGYLFILHGSHSQETPPGEGVVVRGHGTDGKLLVSIEYGEAVLGDGEAGVGRVLQEMEEGPCRGWGWTTASTFCFVLNMKNNTKRRKGQMWKNILYTVTFF